MATTTTCDPGFILPDCTPCAPGSFTWLPDSLQCQPCPLHTFAPVAGMPMCVRCPLTSYTTGVGATECLPCAEANTTFLAQDPTACPLLGSPYNNIIQIGIGMVMFIAFLIMLCRYYAARKKLRHLHFCETRRKLDRQGFAPASQHEDEEEQDPEAQLVAEATGVDTANDFLDEDIDVVELHVPPVRPLPARSAVQQQQQQQPQT